MTQWTALFTKGMDLLHLWTLCQKNAPQIFKRRSSLKNIEQNVKDSCFWASCIADILKTKPLMDRRTNKWMDEWVNERTEKIAVS